MALTLRHLTSEDEIAVRALHEQLLRDDFSFCLLYTSDAADDQSTV